MKNNYRWVWLGFLLISSCALKDGLRGIDAGNTTNAPSKNESNRVAMSLSALSGTWQSNCVQHWSSLRYVRQTFDARDILVSRTQTFYEDSSCRVELYRVNYDAYVSFPKVDEILLTTTGSVIRVTPLNAFGQKWMNDTGFCATRNWNVSVGQTFTATQCGYETTAQLKASIYSDEGRHGLYLTNCTSGCGETAFVKSSQ